jgi:hypothetical protein
MCIRVQVPNERRGLEQRRSTRTRSTTFSSLPLIQQCLCLKRYHHLL